ncbi:MAG: ABC transporter substrate-binding protein [Clostridia bacterium]|nr:ABC transporter substrate-binding protein [Clostridia bacterium]
MKKIASLLLALALILTASVVLLSSCSSGEKLYLFNYGDYIDPEVYDMFEEEYGIKVVYDEYAAPESMYAKFVSGTAEYDLICASDYMLEKLIFEDRLQKINFGNVENFKNISEAQKNASKSFDPNGEYTVPHFWGTLGILYNTETVDAEDLKDWSILFDDKYAGRIVMPDSERDAFFVALTVLGYDVNTKDEAQLREAAALLKAQKDNVQAYLLDETARTKVETGNADIAVIYNGEAYLAFENNENLDFIIPEDKTYMWLDSFAIPKNAVHSDYAELFLNFLCREDIAAMNFEYIYYSTPNQAVIDGLDAEVLAEEAIFPKPEVQNTAAVLKYLGAETEALYSTLWKDIKS